MNRAASGLVASTTCLTDDLCAAVVVGPDGGTALWLLRRSGDPGCAGSCCAPHEQPGPLPLAVTRRVQADARCGAPTRTTGQPCRHTVDRAGERCRQHRPR